MESNVWQVFLMCPVLLVFTFLDLDCNQQLNSYNQMIIINCKKKMFRQVNGLKLIFVRLYCCPAQPFYPVNNVKV